MNVKKEIAFEIQRLHIIYDELTLIANSIGAFFAMNANIEYAVKNAYFISPIVDMNKLISNMMLWANVTEEMLQEKQTIETQFGETLSWKYLSYVRENPIQWDVPTKVIFGEKDNLMEMETIKDFVVQYNANLTVMEGGEHWFHTDAQMTFLDKWITQ